MCNPEDCLICKGFRNIFQPLGLYPETRCVYELITESSRFPISWLQAKRKIWNTEKENKLTFIINACPSSYFMYTLSSALWNMIHVLWFPATERRPSLTLRCHQILQIFPSSCWEGPFSVTFCEGLPFPLWKMVLSLDELPPCNLRIIKTNRILMIEPLADIGWESFRPHHVISMVTSPYPDSSYCFLVQFKLSWAEYSSDLSVAPMLDLKWNCK